ncbi:MAG: response regulator [Acidobacteriota bacterium]
MPRVLVVDDEESIRTYLACLLEDGGYEVRTARHADEALDALSRETFDVVCLDVMMPRRSGIALYRTLRKTPQWACLPAVFISGFSQVHDLRDPVAFRRMVRDAAIPLPERCLEKPVDPQELLEVIGGLAADGAGRGDGDGA